MDLYVPLSSFPGVGRKRPYKIGGSADVEAAQRMYPYITPPMRKPRGEIMGLSITSESSHAPCLQC
jgi:hypothetical protein